MTAANPTLSRATTRAFGVAGIRLALGIATIGACAVRGVALRSALLGVVLGGVVLTMIALGQSSRAGLRPEKEWLPVPAEAKHDPAWLGPLLACIPSTAGVAVMIVVALVSSPVLASILAGVMLALGALAVVSGFELAGRERRDGVRLWVGRGPRPALYVSAR